MVALHGERAASAEREEAIVQRMADDLIDADADLDEHDDIVRVLIECNTPGRNACWLLDKAVDLARTIQEKAA